MRPTSRVLLPVLAALLIGGGLLFYLWWSLHASASAWKQKLKSLTDPTSTAPVASILTNEVIDTGDRVLLSMRQGDILALQGRYADAEKAYQLAVDAGGGTTALRKLAQAQLQRRNIDGAKKTIRALEGEGAKPEDLLLLKVIVAMRTGNTTEAASLLSNAAASPHKDYGTALLSISQGVHEEAKKALLEVRSGWDPVLREYARVLLRAYEEFEAFPNAEPIYLETLLSRALAEAQECELALPKLSSVLAQQSDYRDAWIVQGFCQLTTERYQEALTSLERAYQLDPEKPEIQYFLGRTYSAIGNHKDAQTFLGYAVRNGFEPKKDAQRLLAEEARLAGDTITSLQTLKILAEAPDAEKADAQSYITQALSQGDNEPAYTIAKQSADKWPDDALFHELLGHTAAATERKDEARTAFEKSLQLDGTREGAREGLKQL